MARFTRWMQVLASHRPGLYPTVPLLFTPTWPLLLFGVGSGSLPLLGGVAVLLAVRTLLSWRLAVLGAAPGRAAPPRFALDWLLGEALLLAAFARSLLHPPRVTWRGRDYVLHPGGRMSPVWTELKDGGGA